MISSSASDRLHRLIARLTLPMIVAPMLRVSGLELVEASCRSGVIGAFPTANCRSTTELDEWLKHLRSHLDRGGAPFCPNLIMRSKTLGADLDCLLRHGVEIVITSVGSPKPVVAALHEIDAIVLSDVASIQHARSAIAAARQMAAVWDEDGDDGRRFDVVVATKADGSDAVVFSGRCSITVEYVVDKEKPYKVETLPEEEE